MIFRDCPFVAVFDRIHAGVGSSVSQISFRYSGVDLVVIVHTLNGRRGSCTIELDDQARPTDAVIRDVVKALLEDLRP